MRDCPGCSLPLSNEAICCNSCGWVKDQSATSRPDDWWQCAHEDRGLRCANPGSISPSTHGTTKGAKHVSGPWYCATHVPTLQRMDLLGQICAPPMGFPALRAISGRMTPRPYDFEAEAERLALQAERAEP